MELFVTSTYAVVGVPIALTLYYWLSKYSVRSLY